MNYAFQILMNRRSVRSYKLYHAPAVIFISAPEAKHALADCANAAVYASLAATALGLGSCYIASFRPAFESERGAELKAALQMPEGHLPLYAVAVGYTSGIEPKAAPRVPGMVSWID